MNNPRANWLRAAVLGANDGIVSVASIVVGVAGASNSRHFILTAGIAGLMAGAFSMALGEYVSVSSQRDMDHHANPWQAAFASFVSFLTGGVIPLIAIILAGANTRVPATFAAVVVALIITGVLSARVSRASALRSTARVLIGGLIAMTVTYSIGYLLHSE